MKSNWISRLDFFNSTASGIPHIYCASVPDKFLEFLESLEI